MAVVVGGGYRDLPHLRKGREIDPRVGMSTRCIGDHDYAYGESCEGVHAFNPREAGHWVCILLEKNILRTRYCTSGM